MKKILVLAVLSLFVLAACQQAQQQQDTQQQPETPPPENQEFPTQGEDQVTLENVPSGPLESGQTYEFSWRAEGGTSITNTNIQASFSSDFSQVEESVKKNDGPGIYKGSLTLSADEERTVYLRVRAEIDGQEMFSDTVTRTLIPAGDTQQISEEDTTETNMSPDEETQEGDVQVIQMEAFQFGFSPDPVTVEAGRPVRLEITSTDVTHGIAIPEFGVSKNLPAGETVTVEFTPGKTGEFSFYCTVYCGSGHGSMRGTLVVE